MALLLEARTVIPAPLQMCWDRFCDIDAVLERVPHQRVEITRVAGEGRAAVGAAWQAGLHFAGRDHRGRLVVSDLDPPRRCRFLGGTEVVGLVLEIELTDASPERTALSVAAELTPRGLAGRLILKPLELMKPAIEARFQDRVRWVVAQMMDSPQPT